jgi:alpha-N-arabinofuranosidase
MYKVHHDATLLPLDLHCDDYTCGEHHMPGLSATASRDQAGHLHLTLSNLNPDQAADVTVVVRGLDVQGVSGRVLTADAMTAHNTFDDAERVRPVAFSDATIQGDHLAVRLPAKSVAVLALQP